MEPNVPTEETRLVTIERIFKVCPYCNHDMKRIYRTKWEDLVGIEYLCDCSHWLDIEGRDEPTHSGIKKRVPMVGWKREVK